MEEDGFHQGDHVPAGIVPSTHNCDVKELQKTNGAFLRLDIPPPCRGRQLLPGTTLQGEASKPNLSHAEGAPKRGGSFLTQKRRAGVLLPLLLSSLEKEDTLTH